jgi:hypothetical protein
MRPGKITKPPITEYTIICAHCEFMDIAHFSTMSSFTKQMRGLGWHTVNKLWYCKHCKPTRT